jgi:hypothetical protein
VPKTKGRKVGRGDEKRKIVRKEGMKEEKKRRKK